ncbi:MAG: 3-methylaspartate ammonia-lyase, partial [Deltaproteobacteria bacterium HGW-Deltaproteobacteria-22]
MLSPTAILGYGFPESSFERGMEADPHCIAVDAGSTDPGPTYLGSGKPFTDRTGVKRDLRYMLKAGISRKIPVIIGTAGGSGAAPHVAWCREIIEEIAREEDLHFRMAIIHSDVDRGVVLRELNAGRITPLPFVPELTPESLAQTSHIVAQIGMEPYFKALDTGADVILAGRSYDPAVFAAMPVKLGF